MRRLDVAFTPADVGGDLAQTASVVIDVLRATTVIVRALDAGAERIIPTLDPADARAVRTERGPNVLLGGERNAVRIEGFDLDNSPASYRPETVGGATIAFTTTNGTRALQRVASAGATRVLCAAFANLDALVERLASDARAHLLVVCAGSEGAVSLEDTLCAGAIAAGVVLRDPSVVLTDAGRAAALLYTGVRERLVEAVASGEHAQRLASLGFAADVVAAAQRNTSKSVPIYANHEITLR